MAKIYDEEQLNKFDKETIIQLFLMQQEQLAEIDRKLRKRSIASAYPSYPNFAIITSTSWKIRAKNPNIREEDYGNTTCYSGKAARDLDRDHSGMQEQWHENKGLAC